MVWMRPSPHPPLFQLGRKIGNNLSPYLSTVKEPRYRFRGIVWWAGTTNRAVLPARQGWESIPGLLKWFTNTELEFLKSLWGLGTEDEKGYRTGTPGYIGWRNSFLGIDSWAP